MATRSSDTDRHTGARCQPIDLSAYYNWPEGEAQDEWWQELAGKYGDGPTGEQQSWGIPFLMAGAGGPRAVMTTAGAADVTVPIGAMATYLCLLHNWHQLPAERWPGEPPKEGLVIGEYALDYADGTSRVQPIRSRFEVSLRESPGPPWLAAPFTMPTTVDPTRQREDMAWGSIQYALYMGHMLPQPPIVHYALPNPHPEKEIRSLTIRGLRGSPLMVSGLTLFGGTGHPLRHLPRRMYRVVKLDDGPAQIVQSDVDLGSVARIEHTRGPRDDEWVTSEFAGTFAEEPERDGEDLLELYGAEDATVSVLLEGDEEPVQFNLGDAFREGSSPSDGARLDVLGQKRQWMQVRVIDTSTGKPTPTRIHISGSRGEYIAPYGHHSQINPNWFEDYGADALIHGRSYAYVLGEFTTDLPVGDLYVEIYKGFEYAPVRKKVTVKPGEKALELSIDRWKDLRSAGWVTADTHVHFISPQTAWLEAQGEGVNVVNLLASQWGRLFTSVGDYSGRVGRAEDDTIVQVGTENRNHMLGHMSMLGTQGPLPVYPMCAGGPSESWIGDPDFITMAEWARENKRKNGVVIRPHFPYCGYTEDPVPIVNGLVDALEIGGLRGTDFPTQEWYGYLNNGYRVAVAGGTDKMSATMVLGRLRTYAKLDTDEPFTYEAWAKAVRAGRTCSTTGPLMDLIVDGRQIGDAIDMSASGGTVEVHAVAESYLPLGSIELVYNGQVIGKSESSTGAKKLEIRQNVEATRTGWIAARCSGLPDHPGSYIAAHTSPVYLRCGDMRPFDGPAMEHMLGLVEGGIEYLNTLATAFDEDSRKRMVKVYREVQEELKMRLVTEGGHSHGDEPYHRH